MERKDFENFKVEVIIPFLDEMKNLDTINCLSIKYNAIDKIYKYYQSLRNIVKNVYMVKGTKALDRHKAASACMYGILRAKIIGVKKAFQIYRRFF